MHISMLRYAHDGVLAGSLDGRKAFEDLLNKTSIPSEPEVCFLDFLDINVATTSFLRDSVIAYRNHARSFWPSVYPVFANLADRVLEEFETFLIISGDAFVTCTLNNGNQISNVKLIGKIEGKPGVALRGVLELGEVDAPGLRKHIEEEVTPSAWNNRLGVLVAKGILIEIGSGRNKRYRPVLEGLSYGH